MQINNYEAYDSLPNGVIIFKNSKIEYINQHIIDIFNLGVFSLNNSIDIIMKTIDIDDETELFNFFCNNDYFSHNNKIIQISHSKYDEIDIFSFISVESSLLKDDVFSDSQKSDKAEIDNKVAEHFKLNNIKKVGILTFYKGLPLNNIGTIVRINSDSIEVKVDQKHNISLLDRNDVIIIANKSKSSPAIHGHVEKNQRNIFTITNFTLTKNNMHRRKYVRIKPEDDILIKLDDKEFKIYDLSEKGVSIHVDNSEDEKLLKTKKSLDLIFFDKVIHINTEYLKTVYDDNGEMLKIIFNMYNVSETANIIKDYLMTRQNEILMEIHSYMKA